MNRLDDPLRASTCRLIDKCDRRGEGERTSPRGNHIREHFGTDWGCFSLVPTRNVLNVVAPPASRSDTDVSISGTRRAEICSRPSPLSMREKSDYVTIKKKKREKRKGLLKGYLFIYRSMFGLIESDDRKWKKCVASSIACTHLCGCIHNSIAVRYAYRTCTFSLRTFIKTLLAYKLLRADLRPVNGRAKVSFLSTCAQIFWLI